MPQNWRKSSPALSIELAAPTGWMFAAGDTVIGSVVRELPFVAPEAQLTIRLMGRAKAKIVESRGESGSITYRSSFNFFETASTLSETRQILHQGPLHIEKGSQGSRAWHFSIPIPFESGIDPRAAAHNAESSLLPVTPDHLQAQGLPPTFAAWDSRRECFVEYYLQAALDFEQGGNKTTINAALPITVRPELGPASISDWKTQMLRKTGDVKSYHLAPGMESAALSFRQKGKQFFKSSSVPRLLYVIELGVPSLVQLDHPAWMPLTLRLVPDQQWTSDVLHGGRIKAVLNWIKLTIKPSTDLRATKLSGKSKCDTHYGEVNPGLEKAFDLLDEPIVLLIEESHSEAVDIGAALQLRLSRDGLFAGDKRLMLTPCVLPGFTTYNIRHTHGFVYEVSISIADKETLFKWEPVSTKVLAAPTEDSTAAPPPEPGPSLPSFEDVMRETGGSSMRRLIADTKAMVATEASA